MTPACSDPPTPVIFRLAEGPSSLNLSALWGVRPLENAPLSARNTASIPLIEPRMRGTVPAIVTGSSAYLIIWQPATARCHEAISVMSKQSANALRSILKTRIEIPTQCARP